MKCKKKMLIDVGPRKERLECGLDMSPTYPSVGPNKGKVIWICPRGHTKIVKR